MLMVSLVVHVYDSMTNKIDPLVNNNYQDRISNLF